MLIEFEKKKPKQNTKHNTQEQKRNKTKQKQKQKVDYISIILSAELSVENRQGDAKSKQK